MPWRWRRISERTSLGSLIRLLNRRMRILEIAVSPRQIETRGVSSVTGDITLDNPDQEIVLVDATAGAVTVTLPPLADAFWTVSVVKVDASANVVTVEPSGTETIIGVTDLVITTQYDAATASPTDDGWYLT